MTRNLPLSPTAHTAARKRPSASRLKDGGPPTARSGMRIAVVGAGYVGLVSAACFAELGHHVTAIDNDPARVSALSSGQVPFFEPGLQALVSTQRAHGRLAFASRLAEVLASVELVFIAVGTPPRQDGSADLSAVEAALQEVCLTAQGPLTVVLKSTVPVGTHRRMSARYLEGRTGPRITLLNNPEFLREGSAVQDFLQPDRILVGALRDEDAEALRRAYAALLDEGVPFLCMTPASAELGKYASNAMLASRISFMNEMAQIADATGADIEEVREVVGSDGRIGRDFLRAGMGYGGSCFPKDIRALVHTAQGHGLDAPLLCGVEQANERQKRCVFERMQQHFGAAGLHGKRVALWGLAFKPGTDDLREAPSLVLLRALCEAGVQVTAYDPVAVPAARRLVGALPGVRWADDALAALQGMDALVVATEWDEFRHAAPREVARALAGSVVFDGRNCLPVEAWCLAGLQIVQVGRPVAHAAGQADRAAAGWNLAGSVSSEPRTPATAEALAAARGRSRGWALEADDERTVGQPSTLARSLT